MLSGAAIGFGVLAVVLVIAVMLDSPWFHESVRGHHTATSRARRSDKHATMTCSCGRRWRV